MTLYETCAFVALIATAFYNGYDEGYNEGTSDRDCWTDTGWWELPQ